MGLAVGLGAGRGGREARAGAARTGDRAGPRGQPGTALAGPLTRAGALGGGGALAGLRGVARTGLARGEPVARRFGAPSGAPGTGGGPCGDGAGAEAARPNGAPDPPDAPVGRCGAAGASLASGSAAVAPTGLRTTTGGIGREPGMLIRIRVVSVVSVLGPSESAAGVDDFEVTGFSSGALPAASVDGYWPVPYGGVPDG